MIDVGTRVEIKGTRWVGKVERIHRPGTRKARYNVRLDKPERDAATRETFDVVDCCFDELKELP